MKIKPLRRLFPISIILAFLIIGAGVLSIIFLNLRTSNKTDRNASIGAQNNTYVRVIACVSSVSPSRRTPEYVQSCYNQAETTNHTRITRYGDGQ